MSALFLNYFNVNSLACMRLVRCVLNLTSKANTAGMERHTIYRIYNSYRRTHTAGDFFDRVKIEIADLIKETSCTLSFELGGTGRGGAFKSVFIFARCRTLAKG